jgi:hypothetical protein
MRKYFRWALIALAVSIPLVVVGFFVAMRHAPLTPAQHTALQRLKAPTPAVEGEDASDAIWLLDLDVPEDRRAEVAEQMRRHAFDRQQGRKSKDPAADWPHFPEAPERGAGHCDARKPEGCLAFVTDHRAEVAALLDSHRGGVDALRELWRYDGYRSHARMTIGSGTPPSFGSRRSLLLSDFALRFASGEQLTAVDEVCQDLGGWRRIGGNADQLIVAAVGADNVRQDLVLLADMLHRLSRETELPDSCRQALAPTSVREFDLCPAMRKEFEMVPGIHEAVLRADDGKPPAWAVDWPRFQARRAEDLARFCEPALLQRALADQPIQGSVPAAPRCGRWEKLADPAGCILSDIGSGGFATWVDRRADQAQMLALMRTVVWLRTEVDSKEAVADALKRIPKEFGLLRTPDYDFERDSLSIPLHAPRDGERFELAAGAEPRPVSRRRRMCCSRRPSRNLAMLDDVSTGGMAP